MNQLLSFIRGRRILQVIWVAIVVCAFWKYSYALYLSFILFAITLLYRTYFSKRRKIVFRAVDICVGCVVLSEAVNYAFSQYPPNTFLFFSRLGIAFVLYATYALISNLNDDERLKFYISAYGSSIGLLSLFSFLLFRREIINEGFSDLTNLKYLYAPLGQMPNDWSTVLLIFLAFNIYIYLVNMGAVEKKYRWVGIGIILLVFAIFVTYSRGIYLAGVIFFGLSFLILVSRKILDFKLALRKISIVFVALAGFVIIISWSDLQTIKGKRSTSQMRSTAGRFSIWENSGKMIADHPVVGIGSGNFPLYYIAYENKSVNAAYTTRVNNTFIQLLVEKGVVGFFSYMLLFLCILYTLICQLKKRDKTRNHLIFTSVMLSLCCALFIKELTFSSLFESTGLLVLFFLICVLIRRYSRVVITFEGGGILRGVLVVLPVLLMGWMSIQYYRVSEADRYNSNAIMASGAGDLSSAMRFIDKAIGICPRQAIYYIHRAVLREAGNPQPVPDISDSIIFSSGYKRRYHPETGNAIIADYRMALELNPLDARIHQNIAWQYFHADSVGRAIYHLEKAIGLDPSEELYWLSLGLVSDASGNKVKADQCYINAVIRSPGIIYSIFWKKFSRLYPERAGLLLAESERRLDSSGDKDVVARAKYATLIMNSDDKAATAILEKVNGALPNLSRASLNLGNLYIGAGQTNKGIMCIKRAILLDRNDNAPMLSLAGYLERSKDNERAISYYARALQLQMNAKSTYDERVGRTYETLATLQTCMPGQLWREVNFPLSIPDLCLKLSELYHLTKDEAKSAFYLELSKKRI